MAPTLIEADPDAGFAYPYFLVVPSSVTAEDPVPVCVEPPSLPGPSDEFEAQLDDGRRRVSAGFGRRVVDELGVPFVHPIFPRPVSDPVDYTHYTHMLDRETLALETTPLADIDRQVLAIIEDARTRLAERDIDTRDRVLMNGFSSSANFVNRFAALHPDAVLSVSAGGFNGMAILPIESIEVPFEWLDRLELVYPVGIADVAELTGEPFDREGFRSVKQFLYLGAEDTNDPLLYPDAWTGETERMAAILAYGDDIHEDRFPTCERLYEQCDIPAIFKRYPDTGHEPMPAFDDVIAFHAAAMRGEPIETIRESIA